MLHYVDVKILFMLLQGITSNQDGNYYCMNCLCSLRLKNKLKSHENSYKDHHYCHMVMPDEDNNITNQNQVKNFSKTLFVIYVETESILEKIHACDDNLEQSSKTLISKQTECGY